MNIFEKIKLPKHDTNTFDLSEDRKMSFNMGKLYPTYIGEAVPGDRWKISTDSIIRLAPLAAPIMHRVDCKHYYYKVPPRILWKHWQQWITNTKVAGFVPAHPFVTVSVTNWSHGGLLDHLGLPEPVTPLGVNQPYNVDAMPLAAYQMVWNSSFRDENLIPSLVDEDDFLLVDGDNTANTELFQLRVHAWEHDYFTSNLPTAQKGDPVIIPLGQFNDVPIKIDSAIYQDVNLTNTLNIPPNPSTVFVEADAIVGATPLPDNLYAKTSLLALQAASISALRLAYSLQEWEERAMRAGSRYIENILGHWGVRSSDGRLQRPELIVSSKAPVVISEVVSTADTAAAPQGNMAGHGVSLGQGTPDSAYCEEWCWIIGLTAVLPKTTYQQGIRRMWSKFNAYTDKVWPEFMNLGEQETKYKEIFIDDVGERENTFGYLPHWEEYRVGVNSCTGDFRTTLNFWTMARIFDTLPVLSQQFVEADPTFRVFAVTDENVDHCWAHIVHNIMCTRKISKWGTPGK